LSIHFEINEFRHLIKHKDGALIIKNPKEVCEPFARGIVQHHRVCLR
jgi:hypothetical protein